MSLDNRVSVDLDALSRWLGEANDELAARCRRLAESRAALPERLGDGDQVEAARRYARELRATIVELRRTREADGATFTRANTVVEQFFGALAEPLWKAQGAVEQLLTRAAEAEAAAAAAAPQGAQALADAGAMSETGLKEALVGLPTALRIARIDRRQIDLEALRGYFNDREFELAISRWMRDNAGKPLAGVVFEKVVRG
jgi:hypothetical protein